MRDDVTRRIVDLSPQKRQLLQQLLAGKSQVRAPGHEVAMDDSEDTVRGFYDSISRQLELTGFADSSLFLNYGYVADESPEYATIKLPQHLLNQHFIKLVLEVIGNCDLTDCKILDIGCGRGGSVDVMAQYFLAKKIVGLDLSLSAIEFCARRYKNDHVHFLEGDAQCLAFEDSAFDVVTNIESSHSYPHLRDFYAEVFRVLRSGGYFLYADLLPSDEVNNYVTSLQGMGFVLESDRNVTTNVLLSCDEMAKRNLAAFDSAKTDLMHDFLAVPNSRVYEALRKGQTTYRIFRFRKPDFRQPASFSELEGMSAQSPGKNESIRERLAKLSAEKREFLERLLNRRLVASRLPITPRVPGIDFIPLSFAQQRLWFLDQLEPDSSAYNVLNIISPQIRLHVPTLQLTLNEIMRRHEILRTTFAVTDGQPHQVIAPALAAPLRVVDLQDVPQSQQEAESLRLAASDLQRPFDLTRAPLLRVMLLQLNDREQLLLLTMHHIITDGWSIDLFRNELRILYEAFSLDQPSALPPPPIQYADFSIWQRQWLQKEVLDTLLAYWKKQLDGIPNLLELPTDRARPAVQTFRGATQATTFPLVLSDALKTLSRQEKSSLFMTLLAAFKTLLYRYTGQGDILVGTPVASRDRHEIRALMGFFVNTLVLRTNLSDNPSFRELLERVRQVTLGAYANQDLPFEQLVDALQLQRDLSRTPLFQVMFEVQDVRTDDEGWALLSLNSLKVEGTTAKFDLTLKMLETEQGLLATVEYNAGLFDSLTISRMLGHLRMLLESIVADPGRPISELLLLTADEQHQLLNDWNNTKTEYQKDVCIHQLFEAQVDRTPDTVAVVCEDRRLTYRALNEQANRLACYLRAEGVRPGMFVGICVERSLEIIVGVLGILKAGAAYVPLDPAYPKERLAFMLADSQAPLLLTQERLVDRLPQQQVRVICLDRDWEAISRESSHNLPTGIDERRLAYVIYTSGSTGKPKGVMITHKAVLNTLHWLQDAFDLNADDIVAQKTAASFTDSVWEFFWPLIVGSRLTIVGDDIVKDPHLLYRCLSDEDITITQFVPPLMALFLNEVRAVPEAVPLPRLKWVFNGGEALPLQLAREWYSALSHAKIGNIYGMTESAIYATQHIISEYPESTLSSVPIGRPIANAKVYILDKAGHLSPVGVSGEICIGGLSLADGYLNLASLTAERFMPDPFSGEPGARLYKTGDLGRYLSDGSLQYLGRVDHQVKIRGFRVELGEVEAVLEQHPIVREAVVVVLIGEIGSSSSSASSIATNRLIAYLVPAVGQSASTVDLRPFLKEKLPDYMIPAAFVWLDRLPLTPNGKVDRRSLPEPTQVRQVLTTAFAAPATPVEVILANIWAEVLGLDQVGIHDNFFELGGDSILTIQIVSRANQAGLRMTPRQLFQQQTIAELSKVTTLDRTVVGQQDQVRETAHLPLAQLRAELDWMTDEELQNVETISPVSPLQAGMLFHTVYGEGEGTYIAQLSWRMRGAVDAEAMKEAWRRMLERHSILRTVFIWEREKEPFQVVYGEVGLPWEQYDWAGMSAEEQKEQLEGLLQADRRRGYELTQAPLLRLYLIRLDEESYQFIFSCHHLLLDGWSFAVVMKEVFGCYEALYGGEEWSAPAGRPFVDYIDWLQRQEMSGARQYWEERLKGFREPTGLRVERAGAGGGGAAGYAEQRVSLEPAVSREVERVGRRERLTLSTLVQGGWALVLSRYSGEDDVVFGTTVSGRPAELAGVETMVGLFINTLPQRVRVPDEARLFSWLQELQTQQLERQQYEYSPLVEVQGWSEAPRGQALFESLLVVENYPVDASLQKQPLKVVEVDEVRFREQTNYPLTLVVVPGASLTLRMMYDAQRYEEATIRRLLGHLQGMLEQMGRGRDARLGELSVLSAGEREELLEWNSCEPRDRKEEGIHKKFEEQVKRRPEAIAVVCEGRQLTYEQLNRRANQLAHQLRSEGVGREEPVGICVERRLEMVVAILGVLKAGGVYVPLDPAYPAARLGLMLADTKARVIVTEAGVAGRLPEHEGREVVLDRDWEQIAKQSEANPEHESLGDDLAYIIYTSGSTGKPKGVMVSHGNVARLLEETESWFGFNERDVWTLFHSYAFDFSVWEMWGALGYGGRLVVVPYWISRSPAAMYELVGDEQVTILNQTPSAFYQLMGVAESAPAETVGDLRLVIFGGEALEPQKLQGWVERYGDQQPQLVNMYGITETTVHVTYRPILKTDVRARQPSPIGRRIPDLKVYVLDDQQRLLPVGVPGELYVGGGGVARGYLGRAELTAERFVVDAISGDAGARLYKTGDQGRYLANGSLEFLGRLDHQVKIRGFRVELGEIETVLGQHPSVRETVVVVRQEEADAGRSRLVAYVVANSDPHPSTSELHHFLKEKLPDYMVPGAFVWLERLPRSANGKVDQRALPTVEAGRPDVAAAFVAAQTAIEKQLSEIWAEVLGVDRVGTADNFFELGGDSILSLQIIARANQAGLHLTPRQLFEHQTIAQLAPEVGRKVTVEAEQGLVAGPVPLTPIQHWFFEQPLADAHHFNQAVLLEVGNRQELEWLEQAVEYLVAHHDGLRLRFARDRGGWRQFNARVERNRICLKVDLDELPAALQAGAIEAAAVRVQRSLNLESGPLLRVVYFDLGAEQAARLLLVIHHLAVDGVSWRILLEDLQTLSRQFSQGRSPALPAKTTSFQQWAEHLVAHAREREAKELTYWLGVGSEKTALPVDEESSANTEASTGTVRVSLSREQTQALLQEVPAVYGTEINDILLTALAQAVRVWTGQTKLLVDLEGHGRVELFEDVDVTRTVGWFTSIYPVLLSVPAAGGLGESVQAVKEQLRDVPDQGVGYGILRYLGSSPHAEQLQALPRAQISFNYLGQFDQLFTAASGFGWAREATGPSRSLQTSRRYLLEVDGFITQGQLHLEWRYCPNNYHPTTIQALASSFKAALNSIILHCQSPLAGDHIASSPDLLRQLRLEETRSFKAEHDQAFSLISQADRQKLADDVEDAYPLTRLQLGMLFHSEYSPESAVYHNVSSLRIRAPLDIRKFQMALQRLADRHVVLRTSFDLVSFSEPLQLVHKQVLVPLQVEDLQNISPSEQEQMLDAWFESAKERKFDWNAAPLLRFQIHRCNNEVFHLTWAQHHTILDGWSAASLITELFKLYFTLLGEVVQPLPPRPKASFRDYVALEREALGSQACRDFWIRKMRHSNRTILPRWPSAQKTRSARKVRVHEVALPPEASGRLRQLSQVAGVPLKSVLLAAHVRVLSLLTGEQSVLTGLVANVRPEETDVERVLGLFLNTVPFSVQLPGGRWLDLVRDTFSTEQELLPFQRYPLAELQKVLNVPVLFETLFIFAHFHVYDDLPFSERVQFLGARFFEETNFSFTAIFQQELSGSAIKLNLHYDSIELSEEQIDAVGSYYSRVLAAMSSGPTNRYDDHSPLTDQERFRLLVEWNDTQAQQRDACTHQLFEAQVDQTPDAVALVCEEKQLTYRELNRRANQLAHYLRRLGIRPGTVVGIHVERSPEMLVALLGVLKAEAAYLPLDPAYPRHRLAYMIEDAQISILLTQQHLPPVSKDLTPRVIYLDKDWTMIEEESRENPPLSVGWNYPAYLIYTSGSTGLPKGVQISHRALTNLLYSMQDHLRLTTEDVWLSVTTLSFDIAALELYLPLTTGARLTVLTQAAATDGEQLAEAIDDYRVSVMQATPVTWRLLLESGWSGRRTLSVLCGGEALSPDLARELLKKARALWNVYGPTETTIWSTLLHVTSEDQPITIGRPIANTQLYVLDKHFQPVPVGVTGALYIGGTGLAQGYRNQPGLTAAKFVPNPFESNARMYYTGDLARYLPDGQLEFLGRSDNQVKIRGFRIELGEIETVLGEHPAVHESVVVAREDGPQIRASTKHLVAYVVCRHQQAHIVSELRQFLRERLPKYMMPTAFVLVDRLPLTPGGKIDRNALPPPGLARPELATNYEAPRTFVEEVLVDLWSQVLGLQQVGIHDNFFDLGGDSITSLQIIARAKQFGFRLTPKHLFEHQSIARLAMLIETTQQQGHEMALSPLPLLPAQQWSIEQQFPEPDHETRDFTPSDFPLSRLDQTTLDRLTVTDRQIEDIYTLSPTQEGLLFHTLYSPGLGAYTAQLTCTLRGSLDVLSFRRAWQQILDRHPALRTKFVWDDLNVPLQIVCKQVELPWQQFDWRELSTQDQQHQLEAFRQADRRRGFDLFQAPLVRLTLFQVAEDTYQFILNLHHLILDGWSIALVMKEVLACYNALCMGQPVSLQPTRPYSDYVRWLQRQDLSRPEQFWRESLKGFAEPTSLGIDRKPSEPAPQLLEHAQQQLKLMPELTTALESFSRNERVTLNTILQGAWALLLSLYSGKDDVLFGATVSGRPAELAAVETMVGLFINTLPVRVEVPAGESCAGWLRTLQARQLERQQYEYSRLVDVQLWSEIPRGQPLFETLLVFENYPVDAGLRRQSSDLEVDSVEAFGQTNYPLTLAVSPGTELLLEISFDRERFDDATIRLLLGHLATLLESMASNPLQRLSEVSLLTAAERQQLLVDWNDTDATYPDFAAIHQWFEAQSERACDSVTVVFEDHHISYGVLNERANRLATYLRTAGVGPEVLVGVFMDRSPEIIVGILSVLKAGGAYVPLDPAHPTARLAFMLADSQVPIILTQAHLMAALPPNTAQVISLDSDWEMMAPFSATNLKNEAQADNLAYVIYTSGSTGTPKAVLVQHRSLVAYAGTSQRAFGLMSDDRLLQFASISFDTSVEEICSCLVSGATMVLRPHSMLNSVENFLQQCQDLALTVIDLPTAYWRELVASEPSGCPSSLRLVVIGGEPANAEQLAQWHNWQLKAGTHVRLLNTYGPTEATVAATKCELLEPAPRDTRVREVPIGRPIENVQTYVLDQHLNPLAAGVPGELYIGGVGVTRGYHHRPELTAERFIPNLFSNQPGTRLYRTGDRVSQLPDGKLVFLSRVDQQVKIRGFRVELGEIEATLCQHPAVRDTVVVAKTGDPSLAVAQNEYERLVAYFVSDSEPTANELWNFLKERLPSYMLPAVFLRLPDLPRTPSGKIDRGALPAPEPVRPELDASFVRPRTPVEEILASIWVQVLNVDQVGVFDNFFALGGHSLLATQIISRVNHTFQVDFPLAGFFSTPTVADLARSVEALRQETQGLHVSPLVPVNRDGHGIPLSQNQLKLWFFNQSNLGKAFFNTATAVRLDGTLNIDALDRALNEIARRHEILRTIYVIEDQRPVQVVIPALKFPLPIADLQELPEGEREIAARQIAEEEAKRPFDLAQHVCLRVTLLRLAKNRFVLLMTMHHIASDGWSFGILINELVTLYSAFSAGSTPTLPELPVQYADYAYWEHSWLQTETMKIQLAYWKQKLKGPLPRLELVAGQSRFRSQIITYSQQSVVVPKSLYTDLKTMSYQEKATPFMGLLTSFKVLLNRVTQQDDIRVGTLVANRNSTEIEPLIGFFLNTLVLRTDLSGDPNVREVLRRVRQTALEAYAHQDIPFDSLMKELQSDYDLNQTPLFQVLFIFQNAPTLSFDLPGLTAKPFQLGSKGAEIRQALSTFDLIVEIEECERGLSVNWRYNSDLYGNETMNQLLNEFRRVLEAVVSDPDQQLSDIDVHVMNIRAEERTSGRPL